MRSPSVPIVDREASRDQSPRFVPFCVNVPGRRARARLHILIRRRFGGGRNAFKLTANVAGSDGKGTPQWMSATADLTRYGHANVSN